MADDDAAGDETNLIDQLADMQLGEGEAAEGGESKGADDAAAAGGGDDDPEAAAKRRA